LTCLWLTGVAMLLGNASGLQAMGMPRWWKKPSSDSSLPILRRYGALGGTTRRLQLPLMLAGAVPVSVPPAVPFILDRMPPAFIWLAKCSVNTPAALPALHCSSAATLTAASSLSALAALSQKIPASLLCCKQQKQGEADRRHIFTTLQT
jgi:hypothetical protein